MLLENLPHAVSATQEMTVGASKDIQKKARMKERKKEKKKKRLLAVAANRRRLIFA